MEKELKKKVQKDIIRFRIENKEKKNKLKDRKKLALKDEDNDVVKKRPASWKYEFDGKKRNKGIQLIKEV